MSPLHRAASAGQARAGSLADELPWWGWIDERTLLARNGDALSFAELAPHPADTSHPHRVAQTIESWLRAWRQLDDRVRVSLYLLRRPARPPDESPRILHDGCPPDLIARRESFVARRTAEIRVIAAWTLAGQRPVAPGDSRPRWLRRVAALLPSSPGAEVHLARGAVLATAARLRQMVDTQLGLIDRDTPARLLGPDEATALLADLANRPGTQAPRPTAGELHRRLALSEIEAHRDHLLLDGQPARVYSVIEPPLLATPGLLQDLLQLQGTLTCHIEFRRLSTLAARRRIEMARKQHFARRYSALAHMTDKQSTDAAMLDTAADAEVQKLGSALAEMESDGVPYGETAATIVLHGTHEELEQLGTDASKIVLGTDARLLRESHAQLGLYLARLPGQPHQRLFRRMLVSAGTAACMAPLFGSASGHERSEHLDGPPLALLETRSSTRYRFDLFHGSDVGHSLILGATGSGKSFLLNFLLVHGLVYKPRVCVLDLGGSYRHLTDLLGGGYFALAAGESGRPPTPLSPFALPDTDATHFFLTGWFSKLLRIGGHSPAGDDTTEIADRIGDMYSLPPAERRMGTFVETLPPHLKPPLMRWIGDGVWGRIFDSPGGEDIQVSEWQVIDLAAAAQHPDLAAAATSYFLERLRAEIEAPADLSRLKLLVVDEAWRFLADVETGAYIAESAKTWRKKNAVLLLASQSAADIVSAPAASALLESLPHRIFLANPDMPMSAAEILNLSEAEIELVRALEPKGELYLRTQKEREVLRLRVHPRDRWLYTSNPVEADQRAAAIREHGSIEAALDALAGRLAA